MIRVRVKRTIDAPLELVFATVANIANFSKALPHITRYEFLSEITKGVGTRFHEVRTFNDQETITELEVTEYVENEKICLVANGNGTIWDTTFAVKTEFGRTILTVTLDAKAYEWKARLINPLVRKVYKNAIATDMGFVRAYCQNLVAEQA